MGKAYAALRAALPADQQGALLSDQRQWIGRRDAACQDKAPEAAQCLRAETVARRRFLAGEGDNAADGAPMLRPAFFHEQRKGRYEISISYPQIAAGAPGAEAFNRASRAIAFGKDAVAEYRKMEPPHVPDTANYYQADFSIPYLDARIASVVFAISTFQGGPHPNSTRVALLFGFAQQRPLTLDDLLADPKTAVPALAAKCKTKLEAKAKKEGWELLDDADFDAVVNDVGKWSLDKTGVDIVFDPYAVAAYAVGPRDCRLGFAELAPWLKRGGPLPP